MRLSSFQWNWRLTSRAWPGGSLFATVNANGNGQVLILNQLDVKSSSEQVLVGHGLSIPIGARERRPPFPVRSERIDAAIGPDLAESTGLEAAIQMDAPHAVRAACATRPFWFVAEPGRNDRRHRHSDRPGRSLDESTAAQTGRPPRRTHRRPRRNSIAQSSCFSERTSAAAQAQVPIGTNLTTNWRRFFKWDEVTGSVQVPHAQIAAFSRVLPKMVNPQGTLELNLTIKPNWQGAGEFFWPERRLGRCLR